MDDARRARIESLFEAALDRPAGERDAFLDAACPGDPALRAAVAELLAAHGLSDGLLESPRGPGLAEALLQVPLEEPLPERLGAYRVLERIGRGGMGEVYLAERADGHFRRRVAVKLIRGGVDLIELRRRFLMERQILASLDHPNIGRLLDGGMTGDGRPFLVMEYVEGAPIDVYCDRERLTLDERLRLFCTVARAVDHAHHRLVVHRDLKPSNVLVTPDGVPKLLDFGIAKILDPAALETDAPLTRTGHRLMTPEYASPEQMSAEPVTTASDVYGLGVVLYELLTGRRPLPLADRPPSEWLGVILHETPLRPSAVAVQGTDAERIAAARRTAPARLERQLRGDLDRIVLMALRKEPERRYASAEQLAEDVERHLAGLPVRAHHDSRWYRTRKLVRRHRVGAAAAAVVLASLLVSGVVTAWQAGVARNERDRAREEAAKASRVSALVTDLFRLSDPTRARGDSVTARRLLEEGTQRIESELAGQPELQATMFAEVARVYANLGLLDRAESLAVRALAVRRREPVDSPLLAASEAQLGGILAALGRRDSAIAHLGRAIALGAPRDGAPDSLVAHARASLGFELRAVGRYDESARAFEQALAEQRRLFGPAHPDVVRSRFGLAAAYHEGGRFDELERHFEEVLAAVDTANGPPDPEIATVMLNVAMIRWKRGRFETALPLTEKALGTFRAVYGDDHPSTLEAARELGSGYHELGRCGEAVALLDSSSARAAAALGPAHPLTVNLRQALAVALTSVGRYREAAARLDSSLAMKRERYGGDHAALVAGLLASTRPWSELGRWDTVAVRARAALDMAARLGGGGPLPVYRVVGLTELARAAQGRGRLNDAEQGFEAAVAVARAELRPRHEFTGDLLRAQAGLLVERGRPADALPLLEEALAIAQGTYRSPHREVGSVLRQLGEALLAAGDPARAESVLRRARAELRALPASHWERGEVTSLLGAAIAARRRPAEARPLLLQGAEVVRGHLGPAAPAARRADRRVALASVAD